MFLDKWHLRQLAIDLLEAAHIASVRVIPSFTSPEVAYSVTKVRGHFLRCTCPDHFYRHRECKHSKAITALGR
jgi:hypothetical protein